MYRTNDVTWQSEIILDCLELGVVERWRHVSCLSAARDVGVVDDGRGRSLFLVLYPGTPIA